VAYVGAAVATRAKHPGAETRLLELLDEVGEDSVWTAKILTLLTRLSALQHRDVADGLRFYRRAEQALQAQGGHVQLAQLGGSHTLALFQSGHLDEAADLLYSSMLQLSGSQKPAAMVRLMSILLPIEMWRRRDQRLLEIRHALEPLVDTAFGAGAHYGMALMLVALRACGDLQGAIALADEALPVLPEHQPIEYQNGVVVNAAAAYLAVGNFAKMQEILRTTGLRVNFEPGSARDVMMLCCDAHYARWDSFDRRLLNVERYRRQLPEWDVVWALRLCAEQCLEHGSTETTRIRSLRAYAVALAVTSTAGEPRELSEIKAAMTELHRPGDPIPIGPLLIHECIGAGGMGSIWRSSSGGEGLALKVLRPERRARPDAMRALAREADAAAQLEHPHICPILERLRIQEATEVLSRGDLIAGSEALVMPLAAAGSLASSERPKLDWPAVRTVLIQLAGALAHAHARGVVHLDLKPANLLLQSMDPIHIRLADFGLAHALRGHDAVEAGVAGTPAYMAPEQFEGRWRSYGPWTDIYALAGTAWNLVTGSPPFKATTPKEFATLHRFVDPPMLSPVFPVPAELEGLLRAMLGKAPEERPHTAAEVLHALAALPETASGETVIRPIEEQQASAATFQFSSTMPALPTAVPSQPSPSVLRPRATLEIPRCWPPQPPPHPRPLKMAQRRPPPFVGREREKAVLWQAFREVAASRSLRIVILRGPAGVGRSRLAEAMLRRVNEAVGWLTLRAPHAPERSERQGLAALMRERVSAEGLSGDALAVYIRDRALRWGAEATPDELGMLAAAIDPTQSHPSALRFLTFRAMVRDLRRTSPMVMSADDLQWGGATLRSLLTALEEPDQWPMLVVGTWHEHPDHRQTAEAEMMDRLQRHPLMSRVDLGPLQPTSAAQLLDGWVSLPTQVRDRISRASRGLPARMTAAVRTLRNDGRLEHDVTAALADLEHLGPHRAELARYLRAAAVRGHDARCWLELAAVFGGTVDAEQLAGAAHEAALPDQPDLLADLARHGLVQVHRRSSGWAFRSPHMPGLLTAAAQGDRLRRWHRAAAKVADTPDRRAHHHLLAGDHEAALEAALPAAVAACRADGGDHSQHLADRVAAIVERLDLPPGHASRVKLWELRADIAETRGQTHARREALHEAMRHAELNGAPDVLCPVLQLLGTFYAAAGDLEKLGRVTDRLGEVAAEVDSVDATTAWLEMRTLLTRGTTEEQSAHDDYLAACRAALNDAAPPRLRALALCAMATHHRRAGETRRWAQSYIDASRAFSAAGVPRNVAVAANNAADALMFLRRYDEARPLLHTALAIYRYMEDIARAEPLFNLGVLALIDDDRTAALNYLTEARELFVQRDVEILVDFTDLALLAGEADTLPTAELLERSLQLQDRQDFATLGHTHTLLVQLLVSRRVSAGYPVSDVAGWMDETMASGRDTA